MAPELSRRGLAVAGLGLLMAGRATAAPTAVAATRAGRVRGETDGGVLTFRGIRYGADTGPLRFRPPAPPKPWDGVADALAYGAASPQRDRSVGAMS